MFLYLVFFLSIATSPVLLRVAFDKPNFCSINEYECGDGACVSLDHLCDGNTDCADNSDEMRCYSRNSNAFENVLQRSKRQAICRKNQWRCRDGTCINFDGKCDGTVDCPDGSDETHALCRKTVCQPNWFKCTYGACVDGTAPCNGLQECADNSDELQQKCFKEPLEVQGQFKCENGQRIPASNRCDGTSECSDGSDESVKACAGTTCPNYLFQCAYGACVDQGSDCNGVKNCADGSDEFDELCDRIGSGSSGTTTRPTVKPSQNGACVLPQFPENGAYMVAGVPNPTPGLTYDTVFLNVTCNPGFRTDGKSDIFCYNGTWSSETPKCIRFCKLNKHPSVEYRCLITGSNSLEGTRACNDYEPSGTTVRPQCNAPNYYYSGVLNFMRCIEGSWDYVAVCSPECGRTTPDGDQLIIEGRLAKRGELPWHAGIYSKNSNPYKQICGGSLVTTTAVISAAHCFWSDTSKKLPETRYAVAVGKIYRPWNNPYDVDAQKSDVAAIHIPPRFQGAATNFQDDIALVIVTTAFVYKTYVRPICVDFDFSFDRRQLQEKKMGKVAGWGLTSENGNASQILKVVDLPYIKIEQCIAESPPSFREFITSDKICAGYRNGTALCKGDSGGGLAFPDSDRGFERYYLRGIVSTAPRNENACNAYEYTSFTQVMKHDHFIKQWLTLS